MTVQEGYQVLVEMKGTLSVRGWLRATSGNLSVRLVPNRVAITASGTDKQRVRPDDVLVVDMHGRVLGDEPARPSAETGLHLDVYGRTTAGAVFHVHPVFNNSVGEDGPYLEFSDQEMLKALGHFEPGPLRIPVLVNDPESGGGGSTPGSAGCARHSPPAAWGLCLGGPAGGRAPTPGGSRVSL